jgi:DNA helicase-2/ATP-dependent DNA helicase PcrA
MTKRIGSPDTEADVSLRTCLDQTPKRSFIMVAGAGSGKTTSLVKALARLDTSKGKDLKRLGQKIACVTYTEVAVGEIRGDVGDTPLFHVSTIHSFLWSLVQSFQVDIRQWVTGRIAEKIAEAQTKIDNPRTQARTKARAADDIARYSRQLLLIAAVPKFTYGTGSKYESGILGHDDVLKIGPIFISSRPLLRTLIVQRFPYIFVDESQDTNPDVVAALKLLAEANAGRFCLGFFGDPMQKIYQTGAGAIAEGENWVTITKPENFRCPTSVLNVINTIRREDDGLHQVPGQRFENGGPVETPAGSAKLFLFPNTGVDRPWCLAQVRAWMSEASGDPLWQSDEESGDVRLLVLVHRIAARQLGFEDVFAALNDNGAPGFKEGLRDGTIWAVRPFINLILPLVAAANAGNEFEVISILRANCPRLTEERLKGQNVAAVLGALKRNVDSLSTMLETGVRITVRQVLEFIRQTELLDLDERFLPYFGDAMMADVDDPEFAALTALLATPAAQMLGYRRYITNVSPFETQQGIKGAQFQRVLVVLDDAESDYNLFSYGKYFGLEPLSDTDQENLAAGKDSVLGRTRRLFYVCCSRAVKDLAVVFFVPNVAIARDVVIAKGSFEPNDVVILP